MTESRNKSKEATDSRWCNLPEDLLRLIMSRMSLVDRIRSRTVCKKWLIPIGAISSAMDKLPWAVNYFFTKYKGKVFSYCYLFDPHHKINYFSKCEISLEHGKNMVGGTVCASKYGWLLVARKQEDISATSFMFYNPFSKVAINVPDLGFWFHVATFSLSPTCLDYFIFVSHYVNDGSLAYSLYHNGDKEWCTYVFERTLDRRILDVAYLDGVFYCICDCGRLGAFRVADKNWSWFENLVPIGMMETRYNSTDVHLLATDGHLLLTIMGKQVCKNVIKVDWSKMAWETAKDMGNRTLFLGPTSSSISTIEETGNLAANCNYRDYHLKFTFNDIEKEDGNLQYWEIYGHRTARLSWIEPPHLKS